MSKRAVAAGILVEGKWVVQGGYAYAKVNGKYTEVPTAEVWTPGAESWVEAPEYNSPLPVHGHCMVTINNKAMQIGGVSYALGGEL